jgi:methionyl-tRNA synthetase
MMELCQAQTRRSRRRDFNELKSLSVISSSIERYRFREALGELMNVARLGNKYLADEEPWKMKTDAGRVQTQMCGTSNCQLLSALCEPFLPLQPLNYLKY